MDLSDFNNKLVGKDGDEELSPEKYDFIGLYFSAHWCPPCRGFTPQLAEYYKEMQDNGQKFQVIFLSSDRDEASFKEYFGEMPWLALKYSESETKQKLSEKYGIRGIPNLIILDNKGNTVTADGRGCAMKNKGTGKMEWN